MARTGRPKQSVPRVRWDVYVRADVAAKVELLITDPTREKAKYGERTRLIESLLERWLGEQQELARSNAAQDEATTKLDGSAVLDNALREP